MKGEGEKEDPTGRLRWETDCAYKCVLLQIAGPTMKRRNMMLREKELTYKLRGGLFDVHNEVGLGRSEETYHRAFCLWMSEKNIPFQTKYNDNSFNCSRVLSFMQALNLGHGVAVNFGKRVLEANFFP